MPAPMRLVGRMRASTAAGLGVALAEVVAASTTAWRVVALAEAVAACATVDPGPNFVVADITFSEDYFYCHVEPELLVAKRCGPGDPSQGDPPNGCHFQGGAVTGMILLDHPAVDCGGGEHPLDRSQTTATSPARSNYESASQEMSRDYTTAAIFVRPTGHNHPRAVFVASDPQVNALLATWASK